jgi:DNA-binding ferritin-like protein
MDVPSWEENQRRAEDTIDRVAERLRRLLERAREEGEDMLAEAKAARRG